MPRRFRPAWFEASLVLTDLRIGNPAPPRLQERTVAAAPSRIPLQDLEGEPSRGDLFELTEADEKRQVKAAGQDTTQFFTLYGPFTFPNDTVYDLAENKPRIESIFGIDISHYTSTDIPLERLSTRNLKFVYMKATQGIAY
jgi:lysozyme